QVPSASDRGILSTRKACVSRYRSDSDLDLLLSQGLRDLGAPLPRPRGHVRSQARERVYGDAERPAGQRMRPRPYDDAIDQHHRGDPTRGATDLGRVDAVEYVVALGVAHQVGVEERQQLDGL